MPKVKLLIVDDSPFIHKAIKRALNEDFEVCGCGNNGKEGLELYKTTKPDVVTMDVTMPIMDGLEASKQILEIDPKAKIMLLSAMGDDDLIQDAKNIGIKHFLTKPFKSNDLISLLNNVCFND